MSERQELSRPSGSIRRRGRKKGLDSLRHSSSVGELLLSRFGGGLASRGSGEPSSPGRWESCSRRTSARDDSRGKVSGRCPLVFAGWPTWFRSLAGYMRIGQDPLRLACRRSMNLSQRPSGGPDRRGRCRRPKGAPPREVRISRNVEVGRQQARRFSSWIPRLRRCGGARARGVRFRRRALGPAGREARGRVTRRARSRMAIVTRTRTEARGGAWAHARGGWPGRGDRSGRRSQPRSVYFKPVSTK